MIKSMASHTREEIKMLPVNLPPYFLVWAITLLGFALRFYLIPFRQIPEGDGCHYLAFARDFQNGNYTTIGTYWSVGWVGLIAVLDVFFRNLEFTGRFLSTLAGTLLIPVSFFFTERLFDRRTACFSALLIATNFYLLRYSTYLFTETLFSLLLMAVAFTGWSVVKGDGKLFSFFSLGGLIGLGYWIRMEMLIYGALFLTFLFLRPFSGRELAAFLIAAACFILPLVLFYRLEFGKWTLGSKGEINFFSRKLDIYPDETRIYDQDLKENLYERRLRKELRNLNILPFLLQNRFFVRKLGENLKGFCFQFPGMVFPFPVWGGAVAGGLFLTGLCFGMLRKNVFPWDVVYAFLFPLPFLTLVLFCFVMDRLFLPCLPFFLIFIGAGLSFWVSLFKTGMGKRILMIALVFAFIYQAALSVRKGEAFIEGPFYLLQKEAGMWMREHCSPYGKMAADGPWIPYYFYEKTPNHFVSLPYLEGEDLLQWMRFNEVRYFAVFSWEKGFPYPEPGSEVSFQSLHLKPMVVFKGGEKGEDAIGLFELQYTG